MVCNINETALFSSMYVSNVCKYVHVNVSIITNCNIYFVEVIDNNVYKVLSETSSTSGFQLGWPIGHCCSTRQYDCCI